MKDNLRLEKETIHFNIKEKLVDIVREIGKQNTFEVNLIKILKEIIILRIQKLNSNVLTQHEQFIEKKMQGLEDDDSNFDLEIKNYKERVDKILNNKKSLVLIFEDLERYSMGEFSNSLYLDHINKYPKPKKRLLKNF